MVFQIVRTKQAQTHTQNNNYFNYRLFEFVQETGWTFFQVTTTTKFVYECNWFGHLIMLSCNNFSWLSFKTFLLFILQFRNVQLRFQWLLGHYNLWDTFVSIFPEELTSLALGHLTRNSLFMTIGILLFLMSIAHWNGYERILWKNNSIATYTRFRSFSQWTDLLDCQWACNSLETDSSVWIWLFGLITSVKANTFQSTYKTKHKVSIIPEWKNRWQVTCGDKNNAPKFNEIFRMNYGCIWLDHQEIL